MKIIISFILSFLILSNISHAMVACETYSNVQVKESFHANFLDREFKGCFSYYFNKKSEKLESSLISIQVGKNLTSFDQANATKLSFAAFSLINNFYQVNRKLGNETDQILETIRLDAKRNSEEVSKEINQATALLQNEGLSQYKNNYQEIVTDSKIFISNLEKYKSNLRKVFPSSALSDEVIAKPISADLSPVEKEKEKWISLKNNQQIPFHSLTKIKNQSVSDQILNEIKYARYIQSGKMPAESLPNLEKLQSIEKRNRLFNINLEKLKKNLEQNDTQLESNKLVLEASYQLKKISDQNLSRGELDKADESIDLANLTLEVATSLPMAATGRGLYEFFSGKSLLTGNELSDTERGASLALALIDLTPQAWIAKGVKGAWVVGELSARLVEKGLVKIGFENALNIGIEHSQLVLNSFQNLLTSGNAKLETLKRIVEHKIFFNNLTEEAYLASKTFEKDVISYEKTVSKISTEIGEARTKEILDLPKKTRPLPETYLSQNYIQSHLEKFENGASRFMKKSQFELYGLSQIDGTSFVLPRNEADQVLKISNGHVGVLESELALPLGFFNNEEVIRIDIPNPQKYNVRIPSGNEAGASSFWIPGGKTLNGHSEAVIDANQIASYDIQNITSFFKNRISLK